MIIMNIKVDNLFAFKDFQLNMSYPKKIVNSTIEGEYLKDRPNFRYKKVNIIMGGNATGKTSLGKLLMIFANYMNDGIYKRFITFVDNRKRDAMLEIDFVAKEFKLYRFKLSIAAKENNEYTEDDVLVNINCAEIGLDDNYEKCALKLAEKCNCQDITYDKINTNGWLFSYPEDVLKDKKFIPIEEEEKYIRVLERVLKSLDPAIEKVQKLADVENTYAIKYSCRSVLIKNGKVLEDGILSSGTRAGIDIAYTITSLICNKQDLFYCDELFSYVHTDIEKACLSVMIEKLTDKKQLFFTTHNTDILDMQLPKHSFIFLKKDTCNAEKPIICIQASDYLKRNTDSLKHAVENDIFGTAPELEKLFELAEL